MTDAAVADAPAALTASGLARTSSARWVVTGVFFAFAIGLGLWAGATPTLMQQTGLDARGLGIALTLHSGAYVAAMTGSGWLARHVEPRRLILIALPLHGLAFAAIFSAGSPLALTLALTAMGASAGALDLAMNTEGTAVEAELGRPVLTRMHAAASGAFALGAIAGSLIATRVGPWVCAAIVGVVVILVAAAVARLGPRRPARAPGSAAVPRDGIGAGVWLLGAVFGLSIAAETTAALWSSKYLAQQAAELAAFAGAGAAFFAGCQALIRLFGDPLRRRFGDRRVIGVSLGLAAIGFGSVALVEGFGASLLGFALVGLGTGCVVPCCFALIARSAPQRAAAALGAAALLAGAIRLPTPLYLGFMATAYSDAAAFAGIAIALAGGLVLFAVAGRHMAAHG